MNPRSRTTPIRNPFQTPPRQTIASDTEFSPYTLRYEPHSPYEEELLTRHDQSSTLSSEVERHQTREERLRILRQDALNYHLPGAACFIGEKLMATTGSNKRINKSSEILKLKSID